MDPLSQGVLGASAALSFARKDQRTQAAILGGIGGMLADSDILIRSSVDPLLAIEYHRHFTHSLAFIPVGGLITVILLWFFFRRSTSFKNQYLYATLGYATHGLLDACTTYGTQLLWPFSNVRISWNNVAIIDPIFTITLLVGIGLALKNRNIKWAQRGLALSILYLLIGFGQHERAETAQLDLASKRDHQITRSVVHPTFGNLWLWRSIYETNEGKYFVDAIYLNLFSEHKIYGGNEVNKPDLAKNWPELDPGSVLYKDILRFAWFSDHWLYSDPENPKIISDLRYSFLPHQTQPLWGIEVDTTKPNQHAPFITNRQLRKHNWNSYWQMLMGR